MGLESPLVFPTNSPIIPESGAENGARDDDSATMADAGTPSPTPPDPSAEPVADPLLTRFLDAWNRLSDADRLRLVDESERLAERPYGNPGGPEK